MFKPIYRSYTNLCICFLIVLNLYSKLFRKGTGNSINCRPSGITNGKYIVYAFIYYLRVTYCILQQL